MAVLEGVSCVCGSSIEVATRVNTGGDVKTGWSVHCTGTARRPMTRNTLGTVWFPVTIREPLEHRPLIQCVKLLVFACAHSEKRFRRTLTAEELVS